MPIFHKITKQLSLTIVMLLNTITQFNSPPIFAKEIPSATFPATENQFQSSAAYAHLVVSVTPSFGLAVSGSSGPSYGLSFSAKTNYSLMCNPSGSRY